LTMRGKGPCSAIVDQSSSSQNCSVKWCCVQECPPFNRIAIIHISRGGL